MPFDNGVYSLLKTFANSGSLLPSDLNTAYADIGDQVAAMTVAGGFNEGANVRRGFCSVVSEESRSSASYGLMTTSDIVEGIVVPANALVLVCYQAWWKESVLGAARAAIFFNSNQLKYGGDTNQEASIGGTNANAFMPLSSGSGGLGSPATSSATNFGPSATPRAISTGTTTSGFAIVDALTAGTFDISVQFKSTSGSVTVKNRKLWAFVDTP